MMLLRLLLAVLLGRLGLTGLALVGLALVVLAGPGRSAPLRIEITEGVVEPLPIAVPRLIAETPGSETAAAAITQILTEDLIGTGLFRALPEAAHPAPLTRFDAPVGFADWRVINAQALVVGAVARDPGGRLSVRFRLYDVFAQTELGAGLQLTAAEGDLRRIAHKLADQVYARLTGEAGYFDTRIVFVAEDGPKDARIKRLAIMDYDGANLSYLTGSTDIVLAPRFSPDGEQVLFTSYASGVPQVMLMDLDTLRSRPLATRSGTMSFAPRFGPDGQWVVFSMTEEGNTDLYRLSLRGGSPERLTTAPSIETAPSVSPDGRQIVFESDRSGTQQLYVMPATGGEARRISFGQGRYGTPVWSPRGDRIAFTKQNAGRFHIGVMRTDGSEERLLTASFLDEGPTWAPNGRLLMFTRETRGETGAPAIHSVDISGRVLRRVATPGAASDPAWSPLRP